MPKKTALIIVGILIVLTNFIILDYFVFFTKNNSKEIVQPIKETVQPILKTNSLICPQTCLDKISEVSKIVGITPVPTIIEKVTTINNSIYSGPKEFYVPIDGTGSTTAGNWIDIPGMEIYIDRSKYPDKINATFEASLKVKDNNGEAHARLFNVTKNGASDNSEIYSIGSDFNRVVSGPINLSAGNNLYRVQLFSTTQYEVSVQGAKVRIVVND